MEVHDISQLTLLNKWNGITDNGELTPSGAAAIQAEKMNASLSSSSGISAVSSVS